MTRKNQKTQSPDVIVQYATDDGNKCTFLIDCKANLQASEEKDHLIAQLHSYRNYVVHDHRMVKTFSVDAFLTTPPSLRMARRISAPPGMLLQRIALFAFSRRTVELVVKPKIADMQQEYFDALAQGDTWHARWIHVRETCAVCLSLGLFNLLRLVADVWRRMKVL